MCTDFMQKMKIFEGSVTVFRWVTSASILLLLKPTTTEGNAQNEFVNKWRNYGTITVKLYEIKNKNLEAQTKELSHENVKTMETCFNETYTKKVIPREHYIDVDKVLHAYGGCLFKLIFGLQVLSDYEVLTSQQASILLRHYRTFDLQVSLGDIRHFPMDSHPPQPKTVMTKWVHNHGDASVESTISESVETEDSTTNTMTHSVGTSITGTAEFSFFVSVKTTATAGYSHEWNDVSTTRTVKTLSISDTITVPAKSSAEVIWLLTEQEFKMRWEAPIYLSGAISIKRKSDNKMYFLPVIDMAKLFNEIQAADQSRVFIVIKGIIQGKQNIGSNLQVKEYSPITEEATCP